MAAQKVKLVVVGDSFCGKTCLLMMYTSNKFEVNTAATVFENESKTITRNGVLYNLQLWDTAGQESYDRLRPLVYPQTNVFLICFSIDSKSSFTNVANIWAKEVKESCPEVPIILVGNKSDLRYGYDKGATWISFEDGNNLARKIGAVGYYECSAKLNSGVQKVFDEAIAAAVGRREMGPLVKHKPLSLASRRKKTCVLI